MREIIATDKAPAAIGPYSQAVLAGGTLYVSGQIPLAPASGQIEAKDIEEQAQQSLENLQAVIEAAGFTLGDVVKVTVFLTNMEDFPKVNGVYATFFPQAPPARACVAVAALPRGARVEVEAIAVRG